MKKIAKSIFVFMGVCSMLWGANTAQAEIVANQTGSVGYTSQKEEPVTTSENGVQYTYKFRDSKKTSITITKIETPNKKLVIPAKLDGYSVYKIDAPIFKSTKTLKTVIIKNGVKEIGVAAFANQKQLESVYIPKSVKKICHSAFGDDIKLKEIVFRNPSIKIEYDAFACCRNLQKISFPQGEFTGEIEEYAFILCDLRSIKLPYMKNMRKQIGYFAFSRNKKLKRVTFSSRYKNISLGDGWFADCPKVQIIVGKQVKTFSSKVIANAGTVRLLGSQTRLTGFKKPKERSYYYIQFKKFIVPRNSKALKVLRNAEYGAVNKKYSERYSVKTNYYFSTSEADMHKVKIVIK